MTADNPISKVVFETDQETVLIPDVITADNSINPNFIKIMRSPVRALNTVAWALLGEKTPWSYPIPQRDLWCLRVTNKLHRVLNASR